MNIPFDLRAGMTVASRLIREDRLEAEAAAALFDTLIAGMDGAAQGPEDATPEDPAEAEDLERSGDADSTIEEDPPAEPDVMLGQAHGVAAPPAPAEAAPTAVMEPLPDLPVWSPERDALLLALRRRDPPTPYTAVLTALNKLPGPPVASKSAAYQRLMKLNASGTTAPAPTVDPADLAEARQMMAAGTAGAKALAEYFGWSLDLAQQVAATIRAEAS